MIPNVNLNIWESSKGLRELCYRRALNIEPEMDAAKQAAEIILSLNLPTGCKILDVGCGAGHFIHSLNKLKKEIKYYGMDYSPSFIEIGKKAYTKQGLDPNLLFCESIDDLMDFNADLVLFLNVLSFNPDFRKPIFRAMETGAKYLIIRDNFATNTTVRWELDGYLDEGKNHLMGYWNEYSRNEMKEFLNYFGYTKIVFQKDKRTNGETEMVVGKPYHWEFLYAMKE
jgi:SAM-dependent methyltransferase